MKRNKVYFVGIEGAGTSALASLYHHLGYDVSGSDDGDGFYREALNRKKIVVHKTFAPEHVPRDADWVVYSTAFTNNVETKTSQELGLRTLSYPEAVSLLFNDSIGIAVSGTHGKTTTTAYLTEVLAANDLDPIALVGARVQGWEGNIRAGEGKYFVLEADEYQNKLALYRPLGVILTSVDYDHPDFFPTVADYERVFAEFLARVPRHGFVVVCGDHARAELLSRDVKAARYTYGFLEANDVRAMDARVLPEAERQDGMLQEFSVEFRGAALGRFRTRLAGRHNIENALATIAVALHLKLDMELVRKGIAGFAGTKRRFEYLGEKKGAFIYDDYAHHPAEIRATLAAFRELYPDRRLRVIFHPHTFTRTRALLEEFAGSFDASDEVTILDIYGSARETQGGVSSLDLVNRINHYTPDKASHAPDRAALVAALARSIDRKDVIITMGAGDVWQIAVGLLEPQNNKNKRP